MTGRLASAWPADRARRRQAGPAGGAGSMGGAGPAGGAGGGAVIVADVTPGPPVWTPGSGSPASLNSSAVTPASLRGPSLLTPCTALRSNGWWGTHDARHLGKSRFGVPRQHGPASAQQLSLPREVTYSDHESGIILHSYANDLAMLYRH